MPAIADAILVGDINDADKAFQKFGRTGRRQNLVGDPRGIAYMTASAHEAVEQALAAAELAVDADTVSTTAGHKPQTYIVEVDLSWPTMICTDCKELVQHKLYNEEVVEIACTCDTCLANPPLALTDHVCNCSGCVPETRSLIVNGSLC
jgi:hypothetical protein